MALKIDTFACLQDNYGFLARDEATGKVAIIDAPEPARIRARLEELGWTPTVLLNTHWHPDHAGGNALLKTWYGMEIYGPSEVRRIAPLDHVLVPGDHYMLGETRLDVIDLGGHTLGHIGYVDAAGHNAFIGDCLFPLGCGRLFEGTPMQMWQSLERIAALPADTMLYSAHEYAMGNVKFAESLDMPDGFAARAADIRTKREAGIATVPSTVGEEVATNPFVALPLRETGIEAQAERFGDLRRRKDVF